MYVKPPGKVAPRPPDETVTSAGPPTRGAVVAEIVVASTTVTFKALAPPIVTVAPAAKFSPVTVIRVPPTVGPLLGETDETESVGEVGSLGLSPQDIVTVVITAAIASRMTETCLMVRTSWP